MRIALVTALAIALGGCGSTTTRHDFELDAAAVGSLAAEGALVAHDLSEGGTTAPFVRVHAGELAASARGLSRTLGSSRPAGGFPARELGALAGRVADRLGRLATVPPRREAARIERELRAAAERAGELEKQG